jgi:uncharacterized protein YfaS (alpha-2-macroglobulin family)
VADAEMAVVVVDEAVLALSGYQLADPLATFYACARRQPQQHLRAQQHPAGQPGDDMTRWRNGGMGGGDDMCRESGQRHAAWLRWRRMPAAAPMAPDGDAPAMAQAESEDG